MNTDTQAELHKLLLDEEVKLLAELETVGVISNANNPTDWEGKPDDVVGDTSADPNTRADRIEDYENNRAIVNQLEVRLAEVRAALAKIDAGTYGICEVSGEEIEEERLRANPAATRSKAHMNDK